MERAQSVDLKYASRSTRALLEHSSFLKTLLKILGVLGVSLVMSGMIRIRFRRALGLIPS